MCVSKCICTIFDSDDDIGKYLHVYMQDIGLSHRYVHLSFTLPKIETYEIFYLCINVNLLFGREEIDDKYYFTYLYYT